MPEPIRSPRPSKVATKTRSNPYPRPQQRSQRDVTPVDSISRQSSLLGALKSLVTAPLSWLSTVERHAEDRDFAQKRKNLFDGSDTPPKYKRVRRGSPDAGDEGPAYRKMMTPLWDLGNGVPVTRHQDRTSQSVEPLDSKLSDIHIRRSITRERSMPPPSPFARSLSRVSMTPQPSGATFGPSPKRKRDLTAPPPSSLPFVPSIPTFVRPPSVPPSLLFPKSPARQLSEGPIMSLLTQSKQSPSPPRETPSMLIGSDISHPVSISKVKRTFSTLETFRTPLTSFASQIYPEHRRPRKIHVPLPSKQTPLDESRKKRLFDISPYPTETLGLRKLLQKGKPGNEALDSAEEKMAEVNAGDVGIIGTPEEKTESDVHDISFSVKRLPRSLKLDPYSSLRSPAVKSRRTHISAPQLKKPRNKFSLKEDDVDEIGLSIGDLKAYELKIPKPHLTFTRRMSEAGMQTEVSTSTDIHSMTTPPTFPSRPGSLRESLLEIRPSVISNPSENSGDYFKEGSLSVAESSPNQFVDIASTKIVSNTATSDGPPSRSPPTTPADIVSSKSFASISSNSPVTSAELLNGPNIPLFFPSATTDFNPPPLPTDSIFTTMASRSQTNGIIPSEISNAGGDALPSLPKIPAAPEQLIPSELVDNSSVQPMGGSPLKGDNKTSMVTPLPSAPIADTEKSAPMDIGASIPSKDVGATNHSSGTTDRFTPVLTSLNSSSFVFDSDAIRKSTSPTVTTPPVVPSFTFGLPSTSSAGNAEFTFGKVPSEGLPKPEVNVFNFGTNSPTLATRSQTETSLALPTGNSSTALVETINAEADTQMDVNDQMEESPRRAQEKNDVTVSVSSASPFNASKSMSDSPFSFGSSATKSYTTPFAFGVAGNSTTGHSDVLGTGVFSFENSKTGSNLGFSHTNPSSGVANFNFFSKAPDALPNNFGTTLTTSASDPVFTFGTPPFGPPKADKSVPSGSSAPNSPSLFPQQNMAPSPSFSFSIPASPTTFSKPDNANPPSSPSQPFQFGAASSASSHQPGAIFTLGAATNTPPRKLKGLPQRRRK